MLVNSRCKTDSVDSPRGRRGCRRAAGVAALLAVLAAWLAPAAGAGERVLRFQHFFPATSPQHRDIYLPWAKKVAQASNGRLRIEVTPDMKLGGKPPELISQVEKGEVDIVWTVAGYTPGRFPRLEVFELPWIASSRALPTSQALYEFYERYAREDAANIHLLAVWCHPSGVIMNRDAPMLRPKDIAGRVLRVPSVVVGEALRGMGAEPKLVPAPQVLKLLRDGAVDGALFPYEVMPTLKLSSQVRYITEFAGHRGLYTSVFLLAMSKATYDSLDEQDRQAIDANSGAALSAELGRIWDDIEEAGRQDFAAAGGVVTFVKNDDYEAWVRASEPAIAAWKEQVSRRAAVDADKLIAAARALVEKYTGLAHDP
jgi:TRAP-type C4-dicarboxylate transport system substrate-binding protein